MTNEQINNMAINMLQNNPKVANTTIGKRFLDILRTNDTQAGIELANNLIENNGDTKENAIQKAINYFGNK